MNKITVPNGWRREKLGKLCIKLKSGGTPKVTNKSYYDGDIPFVKIEDMSNSGKFISNTKVKITQDGLNNSSAWLVPKNAIIYSIYASVGEVAITQRELTTNQAIMGLIPDNTQIDLYYLFEYLKYIKPTLSTYFKTTTQKNLTAAIVRDLEILFPESLEEQKKIANILTNSYNAIEETDNIIKESERIKKGLMQELLSHNPNNWRECKLKEVVLKFRNGGTPSTKEKDYWNGSIPWVTGADFLKGKLGKVRRHITNKAVKNSATNVINKGNLLLVTRTGVGKMAIAPFDIAISQDITGVIFKEGIIPEYGYWFLKANISKIQALNQGTSINGIIRKDLENSFIIVPSHDEQQRIIDILNNVDQRLDNELIKKKQLQKTKKGLMQKLLTGQIRVRVG